MSNAQAGWYPQEDGRQRYWDGERWTEHFAPGVGNTESVPAQMSQPAFTSQMPVAGPPPQAAQPGQFGAVGAGQGAVVAARPWFKKKRFIIPAALVALAVAFNSIGGGESKPDVASAATGTPTSSASASVKSATTAAKPSSTPAATQAAPAPAPTTAAPTTKAPAPAPAAPELTRAQENAVRQAESYLDLSGFSQKGLIEQLEFEGFSAKDAQVAISTLKVDWNAEAAESAKAYTDMSGFSRSSLIDQLEFEGYTKAQAKHGADSVGL